MARDEMFCMMLEERLSRVMAWLRASGSKAPEEYLPSNQMTVGTVQPGAPEQNASAAYGRAAEAASRPPQTADEAMAVEYFSLKAMIMDDPTILSMCPRARWMFSRIMEIEQAGSLGRLSSEFRSSFGSPEIPSIPSRPGGGTGRPGEVFLSRR